MSNYEKLKTEIQKAIPNLMKIEEGQIFNSEHYGDIIATKITSHTKKSFSVYGFDIKEGLPRDNYYPRDLKLIGKEPMLNDVLEWIKIKLNSDDDLKLKYHFMYKILETWDTSSPYLKDQDILIMNTLFSLYNYNY